jgi:putative copper resistance protein D
MEAPLIQMAATLAINASLAWIAGALAHQAWMLPASAPWRKAALRRLSAALPTGIVAAAVSILVLLWSESAAMGDVPWLSAWPACREMLTSTHFGHAGVAAVALLALALPAHWLLVKPGAERRRAAFIGVLLLLVFAARVSTGHAFEAGLAGMTMEWLHLLCMSLWAGVVFIAAWLVLPCARTSEASSVDARAACLHAMSRIATLALAGIVASGVYNSFRVIDSARELVDADYGRVLLFKLGLVAMAIALGGVNRYVGLPAAMSSSPDKAARGMRLVITVLRIESLALLLTLAAAAILTNSAPPAG